jgi:uncharacterized protein YfdQ (DUF2303 family)
MGVEQANIQAAIDAGKRIGVLETAPAVTTIEDGHAAPLLVVPTGFTIQSLEAFLTAPIAIRTAVTLDDTTSFITYVNRFKDDGSLIFADLTHRAFTAVLDYPHDGPTWAKHRASVKTAPTPAWTIWAEGNKKPLGQVLFARFIEDNIPNIAAPPGADLLEMCLTLEAKKGVAFRSSVRLKDGQHQLRYEETIEGQAGSGNGLVAIPDGFILALEPFRGVGLKQLEARFRFRIERGELTMWYELVRPDDVLQAAFDELVEQVRADVGEVPVLAGVAPEMR